MHTIKKILLGTLLSCLFVASFGSANSDLYIERITLTNYRTINTITGVIQDTNPRIQVVVGNNGPDIVDTQTIGSGFVVCAEGRQILYISPPLNSLYIGVSGFWYGNNIVLPNTITQGLTEKTISCSINYALDPLTSNNSAGLTFAIFSAPTGRYDLSLDRSIASIQQNLDPAESAIGTQGVVNFVRNIVMNILMPMIIIIAIIIAIIGFYNMMFSDTEEGTKKGSQYLIRGVIGIVLMMSAWYITNTVLFESIFFGGNIQALNGVQAAQTLYDQAIFPFIKIAMYLAMGVLFVIILTRVISYLTSPSEDVKKQAATLIAWNVIGILIILGSKQIVELIFGSQTDVLNQSVQDLGDIGTGIFSGNLPILYTIINRVMGLAAFVILLIIVAQTYQLLTNPTDEEVMGKIKKSLGYIALGIIVIGAGYVITNFLIIN